MSASILWLIIGAILLALEAFGIPGVGFLFVGLGALATAITIEIGVLRPLAYIGQVACFFITSAALAVFLWKRLKSWRIGTGESFSNMIGDKAIIGKGGLIRGKEGEVRWSGTTMRAILAGDAADMLAENTEVTIVAVKGNVLTVR